jgi:hypothetical protein
LAGSSGLSSLRAGAIVRRPMKHFVLQRSELRGLCEKEVAGQDCD